MKKLTLSQVNKRLSKKEIKLLSSFNGVMQPADFLCLIESCNHQWTTTVDSICNGNTGCPLCSLKRRSQKRKLTNTEINKRLTKKKIRLLDLYINKETIRRFQCLMENCNHIWETTPGCIFQGSGCPKCSVKIVAKKLKLTNKETDKRLINRNIKRCDEIINTHTIHSWLCLIETCNYQWKTTAHSIFSGRGCPQCVKKVKLTNSILDVKLMGTKIKRIGNCQGNKKPIDFQCLEDDCREIWKASPGNILNSNTGCPKCYEKLKTKNQKLTYDTLLNYFTNIEKQKDIRKILLCECKKLYVDCFIAPNIIVEYNGIQHYEPVRFGGISQKRAKRNLIKQQERDLYLQKLCDDHHLTLIWIDGRKYKGKKLEKYILDIIMPQIKRALNK